MKEALLDWNRNPVTSVEVIHEKHGRIKTDGGGKKYFVGADGKPDYELPFLIVEKRNENGIFEKVYDSRCEKPLPASIGLAQNGPPQHKS